MGVGEVYSSTVGLTSSQYLDVPHVAVHVA